MKVSIDGITYNREQLWKPENFNEYVRKIRIKEQLDMSVREVLERVEFVREEQPVWSDPADNYCGGY